MPEALWDILQHVSAGLHWLGKWRECNAIILFCRLLRVHGLDDLQKLENYVKAEEAKKVPADPPWGCMQCPEQFFLEFDGIGHMRDNTGHEVNNSKPHWFKDA